MSTDEATKRRQDARRAMEVAGLLLAHDTWPREALVGWQRQRLTALIEHAVAHSPFYRELYGTTGTAATSRLEELPVVDKATMMLEFDRFVCDPRLRLDALRDHLAGLTGDAYFEGEFRAMETSGSSRQRGLFVFDREAWAWIGAVAIYAMTICGFPPTKPRCFIGAPSALHMTPRIGALLATGDVPTLNLDVTAPLATLVDELNRFQSAALNVYPSVGSLLAAEQLDGRLQIAPEVVSTSSEPCTPAMRERMIEAWGVHPFNVYATTETGPLAVDCEHHRGLHLFEGATIVEVVDSDDRPVPDGELGERVLITNLFNTAQPLIRFPLSDMLRILPESCSCGRPHRVLSEIGGRSDDVLHLPGSGSRPVAVLPMHFSGLASVPGVCEFEVVHEADGLHIGIVARRGAEPEDVRRDAEKAVRTALHRIGVGDVDLHVSTRELIMRDERLMGKARLVRSNL